MDISSIVQGLCSTLLPSAAGCLLQLMNEGSRTGYVQSCAPYVCRKSTNELI